MCMPSGTTIELEDAAMFAEVDVSRDGYEFEYECPSKSCRAGTSRGGEGVVVAPGRPGRSGVKRWMMGLF